MSRIGQTLLEDEALDRALDNVNDVDPGRLYYEALDDLMWVLRHCDDLNREETEILVKAVTVIKNKALP